MTRLFIIGLLFLLPFTAYSKDPSVAPDKSSGIQQGQSQKSDHKTETNNRGSDKSPVFIKIIPSDPTHEQAEQEKNDKLDKSFNDKVLVYSTLALTIATIILAFFTYRLWNATVKMSIDAKETSARQAAEMIKSLDLTKESVDLSRKEFILTQRPILRVSTVIISRNVLPGEKPGLVAVGKPVNGQFYISNVGGTPATIINIGCWVHAFSSPLPMKRPYEGENGNISIRQTLNPGESTPITFTSEPLGVDHQSVMMGTFRIYVMGWIEYRDDLNINRRLNFCRVYRVTDSRFFPVDDTDYESQY